MPVKLPQEMDIETRLTTLMAQTGARDRANMEKHLAVCDAEPNAAHGTIWRRLMAKLGALAPIAATVGLQVVRFFIADGKYRMQVFALEDNSDGFINVYLPNVLSKAVSKKLLVKTGSNYSPASAPKEVLTIEQMDANTPTNPPDFVKHMTGWNRKAMKLTLPANDPDGAHVSLVEALADLASTQWKTAS